MFDWHLKEREHLFLMFIEFIGEGGNELFVFCESVLCLICKESLQGLQRRLLVYPGERSFTTKDGIEVVAFSTFTEKVAQKDL